MIFLKNETLIDYEDQLEYLRSFEEEDEKNLEQIANRREQIQSEMEEQDITSYPNDPFDIFKIHKLRENNEIRAKITSSIKELFYIQSISKKRSDIDITTTRMLRNFQDDIEQSDYATLRKKLSSSNAFLNSAIAHNVFTEILDQKLKIEMNEKAINEVEYLQQLEITINARKQQIKKLEKMLKRKVKQ